eukprot:TRINITY_DN59695_c0_g1_i1.p1 TRINITY_DN59695_c0_g1~~TRINITY_DN59695_c0_g1_i1.p1  ORF type:complete len:447 (+),score=80.55 TRINITY_DN59695_c0_g1_i1:374-1714(+)
MSASPENIEQIKEVFRAWDADGSGTISLGEMKAVLQKLDENMTDYMIDSIFGYADKNGDGVLNFSEFVDFLLQAPPCRDGMGQAQVEQGLLLEKTARMAQQVRVYLQETFELKKAAAVVGSEEAGDAAHLEMGISWESLTLFLMYLGATHRQHPPTDSGAIGHLSRGHFNSFVEQIIAKGPMVSPFRRDGDSIEIMPWYHDSFPMIEKEVVDRYLTGYEACDLARDFLKGHHSSWESLSVLEVLHSQACPGVGLKATRFFSHCQAEPILDSLLALFGNVRTHSPGALFFFDVVSIRQLSNGDFKPATVEQVIGEIGHTVLMLYPLREEIATKRLWCVYEIASTVITDAVMSCAPQAPEVDSIEGMIDHAKTAVKIMREMEVDLGSCSARKATDKEMIMDHINQKGDGVDETSKIVQKKIRDIAEDQENCYRKLFSGPDFPPGTSYD